VRQHPFCACWRWVLIQNCLGYLTKSWESKKLVIKKCLSSQIPFFTYKPLTKFGFEAHQIWIIQTHRNTPKSPNSVIWVTQK
jgi:hypothetical protein